MKEITVTTQSEIDSLPDSFSEYTVIIIKSTQWIYIKKARGNSSVEAWENSSVVARENSSVVARENSSVVARENSSVEAWENSGVHLFSIYSIVNLFSYSVCWVLEKGKVNKKSVESTVIRPKIKKGTDAWLEREGIKENKGKIILFKRISSEFKTQENTRNETLWSIESVLKHPNWNPKEEESGEGKYHACSRPYFCDEFRNTKGDLYIAIQISKKDLYAWDDPSYPHKIAFRSGKVLYKCDRFGKQIV